MKYYHQAYDQPLHRLSPSTGYLFKYELGVWTRVTGKFSEADMLDQGFLPISFREAKYRYRFRG